MEMLVLNNFYWYFQYYMGYAYINTHDEDREAAAATVHLEVQDMLVMRDRCIMQVFFVQFHFTNNYISLKKLYLLCFT